MAEVGIHLKIEADGRSLDIQQSFSGTGSSLSDEVEAVLNALADLQRFMITRVASDAAEEGRTDG